MSKPIKEVIVASRKMHRRASIPEFEKIQLTLIDAPVHILIPKQCLAETFSVPQGTEIRIKFFSKR